jgi:hypothetical protein
MKQKQLKYNEEYSHKLLDLVLVFSIIIIIIIYWQLLSSTLWMKYL